MSYARKGRALGASADAEIAKLKEANVDLGYQLAAADVTIEQQEQALLEKNAEIENLNGIVMEWQEYSKNQDQIIADKDAKIFDQLVTITGLEAALEECRASQEPPEPSEPASIFGSSTGKHSYSYFTLMAGAPLKVRRSYDTWPAVHPKEDAGRNASVWSFKPPIIQFLAGQLDVEFIAALKTIPDDEYNRYLIIRHEPEDDIERGEYTYAQYIGMQKRAKSLVDQVNATRKRKIRVGGNWMAWTFQSGSGRNPENYWPGDGVWDFLAFDGYAQGRTPAGVFDKPLEFCRSKGVRFAVAETGIDVSRPEGERVAWIKECREYAKNANCEFWCYWDGSFSTFWLNTEAEFKAVVLGY